MNTTIKNSLGVAAGVGILALGIAGWRYAGFYGASIEPSSFRSFSVSAEGKTVTIPDVAHVTLKVLTEGGANVGTLQRQNTEKMNRIIAFVKSKKVEGKDIQTQSYSIEPRYQNFRCVTPLSSSGQEVTACPPAEIVGYTIRQELALKIRDFSVIGDILSGAVEEGANSMSGPSFAVDDLATAEQDARAEAIETAKEKAAQIAKTGGFSLGRLLSIEEGFVPAYAQYERGFGVASFSGAPASAPTIEPGSEEVKVTVTLRYEIR